MASTNAQVSISLVDSSTTDDDIQNAPTPEHYPLQIVFAQKSVDGLVRSTPAVYMPIFPDTQALNVGVHTLGKLQLLRRGLQVVHVFGLGNIGLECLSQLNASVAPVSELGEADNGSITVNFRIFSKSYSKSYQIPINIGVYAASQIQRKGRRTVVVREDIQFSGNTERRVQYWYCNPNPKVLQKTRFVNAQGKDVSAPRNVPPPPAPEESDNAETDECSLIVNPPNKDVQSPSIRSTQRGTERSTFYASEPCWGSIRVEYDVDCYEFFVLYDHGNPEQKVRITQGIEPERVGYTVQKADNTYEYDVLPDSIESDGEIGGDPPAKSKLIKKAEYEPLDANSFIVFAENGNRNGSGSFNATPQLIQIPQAELPRFALYQLSKRTKVYPDGAASGNTYIEVDHRTRVDYLDPFGTVIMDNFSQPLENESNGI